VDYIHDKVLSLVGDCDTFHECRPLDHVETINGIDGVHGINSMNMQTSMGWPKQGKKLDSAVDCDPVDGISSVKDIPGSEERYKENMKRWKNMETVGIPFIMFPKVDEVRPPTKPARMVCGCGFDLVYAVRRLFLAPSRVIQSLWRITGAVLGMNVFASDWTKIAEHLEEKSGDKGVLPGDYSSFDTKQTNLLLRMAWKLLILIAMATGNYTTEEIEAMYAIVSEVTIPIAVVNDVLVQLVGGGMSGQPLTTIINSIVNWILIVYCIFSILGVDVDPEEEASFVVLGDDNVISPKDDRLTHVAFQEVLAKIGCKYTLDIKDSTEVVERVPLGVATFCKRGFIRRPEGFAAPLEEKSIVKSLYFTQDKKRERAIQELNISSALFEWSMHGEEIYNDRLAWCKQLAQKHDLLSDFAWPTYSEQYARWLEYQAE
jgi:hypothetical protein